MKYLRDIIPLVESMAHKITSLRAKTVARGATPHEAASAHAKANELEKKYPNHSSTKETRLRDMVRGQGSDNIHSSKAEMKSRWAGMHADMKSTKARRKNWTKAQWDAHLAAHERDERDS